MRRAALIIFLVLFIDQASKIWIKTHMYLGQEYHIIGNSFIIHFTENYGMAFGLEFGGQFGKFFLSIFRIIASLGIGWYLLHLIKHKAHKGAIISFALIFAGAIGNIIDSAFYGMIFSDSEMQLATMFPPEGGYAGFLQGRVVDMLYFPLIHGHFPQWFPIWGGEDFLFFRPVFNVSDSAISVGVFLLLLFHNKFFPSEEKKEPLAEEQHTTEPVVHNVPGEPNN